MSPELRAAYQHCFDVARSHYENFPTASLFFPRHIRPAIAAIYAFARKADDIADEGGASAKQRSLHLDAWETLLSRCVKSSVDHPVFIALSDTICRFSLPVEPFRDLLTAFRMDVTIHAYANEEALLFYCRHSANPIGRLILALYGIDDHRAMAASDALCTALQLTNFWQDMQEDLAKGRCYIPQTWLEECDLNEALILNGSSHALRPLLDRAFRFTSAFYQESSVLIKWVPFRLGLYVSACRHGGMRMLQRTCCDGLLGSRLQNRHWVRIMGGVFYEVAFARIRSA